MAKRFSAPADGKSSCGLSGAPWLLPQKQLGNIVLLVLHGQFGLGSRDLPDYWPSRSIALLDGPYPVIFDTIQRSSRVKAWANAILSRHS
jgi:hypothetical protein